MILAVIAFPMLAILGVAALVALAPARTRWTYLLPAVRTVALVTAAVIYIAAIWEH